MRDIAGISQDRAAMLLFAQRVARPVLSAADDPAGLCAAIPKSGDNSRHAYAGLEALGRLLAGIAPALEAQAKTGAPEAFSLDQVHRLIARATDPADTGRLNFDRGAQPLVDAAFLAQAIVRAPVALWDRLDADVRGRLLDRLYQTRAVKPFFSNWLLFPAMIEAMFARVGAAWDHMRVDLALRQIDAWYVGDGFYADGPSFQMDYYNAFVIQPMLSDILSVVGDADPYWKGLAAKVARRRLRQVEILERMIGPDGSFPPLGRSITYRCAAFQPLAQAALQDSLPDSLPPGQARAALMAVIRRSLGLDRNYDEDGWLRIGLNGSQPGLAEHYISTGSLYLCATAFLPLGLAPDAPFWIAPAESWTQKRLWDDGEDMQADRSLEKQVMQ